MFRPSIALACLLVCGSFCAADEKKPSYPSFDYRTAVTHEIKPHRRTIPTEGVPIGSYQLHLSLTVSPAGDVTDAEVINAETGGDRDAVKYWPKVKDEVFHWKFTPFGDEGKAVTAEVEEYVDIVPPEGFPAVHVAPPEVRPDSNVAIELSRSICFGSCPAYSVTVSTKGLVFEGSDYVAVLGRHTAPVDAEEVRGLARRFVAADFYSMNEIYKAPVFDSPSSTLSITIDGKTKRLVDHNGEMVGMPAVITELEDEVDTFARTDRWIDAADGLVEALKTEKFNFQTFQGQLIVNEAATRGRTRMVQELMGAGVPLKPLPAPAQEEPYLAAPFEIAGWLSAACGRPDTLKLLIERGVSRSDQSEKDLALSCAVRSGNIEAVRELIAYGANPNARLSRETSMLVGFGITMSRPGPGSILIYAAQSGNPEMVREILRYHPDLEARGRDGKTAIFWAGKWENWNRKGSRVECVRLLAEAGANVNARDDDGHTLLHVTPFSDVIDELKKFGAK